MPFDRSLSRAAIDWRAAHDRTAVSRTLHYANYLGDPRPALGLIGVTYLGGLIAGSDHIRVTGRLMGESLLLSGIVTGSLKVLLGRARPHAPLDPWNYQFLEFDDAFNAMPSGHATVAFALASVAAERIESVWIGSAFYSIAALTAVARIERGRHWFSDVLAGAAIGTMTGLFVCAEEEEREAFARETGLIDTGRIRPSPTLSIYPTTSGVAMAYRF